VCDASRTGSSMMWPQAIAAITHPVEDELD